MKGQDGGGKSSFSGARSANNVGWANSRDGSVVANATMNGNDFVVQNGTRLRTGTAAEQSFAGASLKLESGGELFLKAGDLTTKVAGTISILQLIGDGGTINHAVANTQTIEGGSVRINEGKVLNVRLAPSNRTLIIASEFEGDDTTELAITSSFESGSNGQVLELQNAAGFSGTITGSKYNADATGTFALKVTGGFSGTITSLPSDTTQVLVNIDDATTANGLRVATTTIPESLKNTVVLYSNKKSALSAGDIVMTFPAGTEVVPAEFAVAFAYGVSGAESTLVLETAENSDGTVSIVVKNGGGSTYVWTGEAGDGKMSTGGNWEGGSAPGAGAVLNFSKVTAATSIAANGLTYAAVTMGTGVIAFSGSLTATSFSDTANIAVGANSTVTLDGDLKFSNDVSRYILKSIDEGGRFVVMGTIELTGSAIAEIKPFEGTGVLVSKGLVANASKNTGDCFKDYIFRLSRPTDNTTIRWIIGEKGLSGSGRFWCFGSTGTIATIQPNESDFNVTTTIGVQVGGTLNLNTTGYDGKAHKIIFTGDGSINQGGTVNIKGNGVVELENSINGELTVYVNDTATLSVKRGKSPGNKNSNVTVKGGATLEVAESAETAGEASVALKGNLTLNDGAILAFDFTDRSIAPVLASASDKMVTVKGMVYVKISADAKIERPRSGEHILTSSIDFTGKTVVLADSNPDWVNGVSVDVSGNIVVDVKPTALMIIVR